MTFEQRPLFYNGHYFWVPRVVVVHRFNCTSDWLLDSNVSFLSLWRLFNRAWSTEANIIAIVNEILWRTNRYSTAFHFVCKILANLLHPVTALKAGEYRERPWSPLLFPESLLSYSDPRNTSHFPETRSSYSDPRNLSSPKHSTYSNPPINSWSNLSFCYLH